MNSSRFRVRAVGLFLIPLGIALFFLLAHVSEVHASSRTEREAFEPATAPLGDTRVAQGGVISTIQSVINYVINATVFFPARTFQEAIEKATRNIFSEQLTEFREPLEQVVAVYAFQNGAVFGSLAIPGEVNAIGARLTEAAVPVWALSLVLIGLSVLTRNAVGMGHGTVEVAAELARWLFIALASGNAIAIVNLVHTGFGALTYAIASEGGTVTAGQFVAAFIPNEATLGVWPILLLVIGCVLGLIVILVLSATYIARYIMLLAITGLAPICLACEGIPFTRFVFRDWLSMFLRLEFLQIINIAVLIVFKAMALGAAGSGVAQALLRLAIMIGLASAIIGINLSIFKQVFGVAIDVVAQMRQAAEQIVRVIGVAIGAAVTGGVAVPALAGAAGAASTSPSASEAPALQSGETDTPNNATHAAATGASGRAAWAMAGALGGPAGAFMRGYGDGAFAASDFNARRAGAAKAEEMQRAAEMRRAESLAREMGATHADDIEAITRSVTEPEQGHTPEQMMRAHRDNAPALREMAHHYGGPARAAAIGGYRSFGDMAIAMAQERLHESDATAQKDEAPASGRTSHDAHMVGQHPSSDASSAADSMPQHKMASSTSPAHNGKVDSAAQHENGVEHPSSASFTAPYSAFASDSQHSNNGLQVAGVAPQDASASSSKTNANEPIAASANGTGDGLRIDPTVDQSNISPSMNAPDGIAPAQPQPIQPPADPASQLLSGPEISTAPASFTPSSATLPSGAASNGTDTSPSSNLTGIFMPDVPQSATPPAQFAESHSPPNAVPPLPRDTPLADWAAQVPPAPIHDWIHTPPHIGSPGEQSLLPFDFGVGAMLTRATESSPTHAPLWAQTAYSLRMAYGESYVTGLMQEAQQAQWSETELMSRVERHVDATPSPRVVSLFWKPGDAAMPHTPEGRGKYT